MIVGADGRNSALARRVGAPRYETAPTATCWYFSYYSGVSCPGLELYARERRVIFAFPTNDGLVGLFVGFPLGELNAVRGDVEGHVRKPYGQGWALVGDAGCHKDPFMALGICDALRDAETLADALTDGTPAPAG